MAAIPKMFPLLISIAVLLLPSIQAADSTDQSTDVDIKTLYDIITGDNKDKGKALHDFLSSKSCDKRTEIEKNIEAKHSTLTSLFPKTRVLLATSLYGCDSAVIYAYYMKILLDSDDKVGIAEVLATCSETEELHTNMQKEYLERFDKRDLKEDIPDKLDGDFKNMCLEYLNRARKNSTGQTDNNAATNTAKELADELIGTEWKNDRKKLDACEMETSLDQLKLVFAAFAKENKGEKSAGKTIRDIVEDKFKDDTDKQVGYMYLYDFIDDKYAFLASRLENAFKAEGDVDMKTILRILSASTDDDRDQIISKFQEKTKSKIQDKIKETAEKSTVDGFILQLLLNFMNQSGTTPTATPAATPTAPPAATPTATPVATQAATPASTPAETPTTTPAATPTTTSAATPTTTPAATPEPPSPAW